MHLGRDIHSYVTSVVHPYLLQKQEKHQVHWLNERDSYLIHTVTLPEMKRRNETEQIDRSKWRLSGSTRRPYGKAAERTLHLRW